MSPHLPPADTKACWVLGLGRCCSGCGGSSGFLWADIGSGDPVCWAWGSTLGPSVLGLSHAQRPCLDLKGGVSTAAPQPSSAFSAVGRSGVGGGILCGPGSGSYVILPLSVSRTESVAEKMLTNWFTFLLYKFLKVGGLGRRERQEGAGGR